jgi:ATP-dependent Clp protease ATP-binding subunit ClpX
MITNHEILEEINRHVFGHERAKKTIINLVNRSKTRYHQKWGCGYAKERLVDTLNCTLVGPSGTGKTHLVEMLSKIMGFPFIKFDATDLTHTSASGGINTDDMKKQIKVKAGKILAEGKGTFFSIDGVMDQMIIFIDEIDKLGDRGASGWNQGTQANFLTMFDKKDGVDGFSFIFAGAFSGMDYGRAQNHTAIGFYTPKDTKTHNKDTGVGFNDELDQKIIKYGLIPEMVGRMGNIVLLDELKENDYRNILLTNILPKTQIALYELGIPDFDVPNWQLDEIIASAMKSGQGVRHMQKAVDHIATDVEFNEYYKPNCVFDFKEAENE